VTSMSGGWNLKQPIGTDLGKRSTCTVVCHKRFAYYYYYKIQKAYCTIQKVCRKRFEKLYKIWLCNTIISWGSLHLPILKKKIWLCNLLVFQKG